MQVLLALTTFHSITDILFIAFALSLGLFQKLL